LICTTFRIYIQHKGWYKIFVSPSNGENNKIRRGNMAVKCDPYHSVDSKIYHIYSDCSLGNNIEVDKKRDGKGENRPCKNCEAMKTGHRKR
jgi:hypothetical protein